MPILELKQYQKLALGALDTYLQAARISGARSAFESLTG
mgnify:FL=1|jgi:hypothetical protein